MLHMRGGFVSHCATSALVTCLGAAMLIMPASLSSATASPSSLKAPAGPAFDRGDGFITRIQAKAQIADFKASNVAGPAGRPLAVKIETLEAGAGDKGSGQLFIFTGLPDGVTLSPGGNFGEFWAVNAAVIKDLTLTAPEGYKGTFTIWITRSRDQAHTAQSASIAVTIGQPATTQTAATAAPSPREKSPAPVPAARPGRAAPANEPMLLARARDSFAKGDVAGARVVYEYLALQGSPAAAMAMGETYDPLVLATMVVKGLEADAKKAQQWYEKAEELGNREARSRLNALAAR